MKLEEAIIDAKRRNCFRRYAIMSDGHGKTTDQIADAINRNASHVLPSNALKNVSATWKPKLRL